jgi:hypothetical protein
MQGQSHSQFSFRSLPIEDHRILDRASDESYLLILDGLTRHRVQARRDAE